MIKIKDVDCIHTPDLHIIYYGVGLPGSQHDSTAWAETRIYKERDQLLDDGQFVWGDSTYPIETWCQAPYKKSALSYFQPAYPDPLYLSL